MIDWTEVGKTPLPTDAQLKKEGTILLGREDREYNSNWKGGQRTDNQKEYDRIRHRKNWLKAHPNAGTLYNQNRDHIDQKGKNNNNYRHGRYVVDNRVES